MSIKLNSYRKICSNTEANKNYANNYDRIFKPRPYKKLMSEFIPLLKSKMPAEEKVRLVDQEFHGRPVINFLDELYQNIEAYR